MSFTIQYFPTYFPGNVYGEVATKVVANYDEVVEFVSELVFTINGWADDGFTRAINFRWVEDTPDAEVTVVRYYFDDVTRQFGAGIDDRDLIHLQG